MKPQLEQLPCVSRLTRDGRDLVAIGNERIRLLVWPDHGCDVVGFVHTESDCDVLWRNPRLQPPRTGPLSLPNRGRSEFYDTFNGGWMLSLPGGFPSCDYYGAPLGTLGEYAQLPWQVAEIHEDRERERVAVVLTVRGIRTPFAVTRTITVNRGAVHATFNTAVRNEATRPLPVAWIEHLLLGGPILEGGRVIVSAADVVIPPASRPELTQLQVGTVSAWPRARAPDGSLRDVSRVPNRGSEIEHLVMLENLHGGYACLWNASLNLGFELRWDAKFFPRAWLWATGTGGSEYPMWGGAHVVGLEPATCSPRPFDELVERGEVRWIAPGARIETEITAGFCTEEPSPNREDDPT